MESTTSSSVVRGPRIRELLVARHCKFALHNRHLTVADSIRSVNWYQRNYPFVWVRPMKPFRVKHPLTSRPGGSSFGSRRMSTTIKFYLVFANEKYPIALSLHVTCIHHSLLPYMIKLSHMPSASHGLCFAEQNVT